VRDVRTAGLSAGRPAAAGGRAGARTVGRVVVTVLAALLVWFALVAPEDGRGLSPAAFLRVPLEGLVLVGVALVVPRPARRWVEVLVGLLLGVLVLVRLLDLVFLSTLYRRFNPLTDWRYVGSARDLLGDSLGGGPSVLVAAGAGLAVVAIVVGMPLAVRHLSAIAVRHRTLSVRVLIGATATWLVLALTGAHVVAGVPVASSSAAALAVDEARTVRANLHDRGVFGAAIPVDAFDDSQGSDLLTALRGKDVVVIFVESYGRVAVEQAPAVAASLRSGGGRLAAAGYSTRSAWLTSPTFGGISWLAHSTLQSGLWVDSQQRYDQLLDTGRLTLSGAFARAGWRTVDVVPANRYDWPEGIAFYGYDRVYDARTLGYAGPGFGYAPMPDQYTLSAFDRAELGRGPGGDRPPVMAEIDLVTSHVPWAPLPRLVSWDAVGDGSIYLADAGKAPTRDVVWRSAQSVRSAYGRSVAYSLDSVVSFLTGTRDKDLVAIVLGDHQPASIVSGPSASHDVPVTLVARDPAVAHRISTWGWTDGLRPRSASPVWPMDAFRDRFLRAFSPPPQGGH
jgi:hypothetical protein